MSKNKPKVSIVVITYNQESYLRHTLESIIAQNVNFDYEVLVGEDHSPDNTADIVREFAEKYPDKIIPYIREQNMGMSPNFVDLILRTQGEYIAVIEGDDYWIDNNMLQKHVDFLDANRDYVACFAKCIIVDENEIRHPEREQYSGFLKTSGDYSTNDFEEYILPGQTATAMYRQEIYTGNLRKLEEMGFDIYHYIDRHFVLMMLASGKIKVFDDEVSAYRYVMAKESGSWSSKNDYYSLDNLLNYLDGLKELEDVGKALGLQIDFDNRRIYEWDKFLQNKGMFSKAEASIIKKKLIDESNDHLRMIKHKIKKSVLK